MTVPIWGNKHFNGKRTSNCLYNGENNAGEIETVYSVSGYPMGISSDGILYAFENDKIHAINIATEQVVWTYSLSLSMSLERMCLSIDSSGNLYFIASSSKCISLSSSGVLRWSFSFTSPFQINISSGDYSLVISNYTNRTYVCTFKITSPQQSKIYAINNADGSLEWEQTILSNGLSSIAIVDGNTPKLFISGINGGFPTYSPVICFEDLSGSYNELWQASSSLKDTLCTAKIDSNLNTYFCTSLDGVVCVNNGTTIWSTYPSYYLGNYLSNTMMIDEANGKIYAINMTSLSSIFDKIYEINSVDGSLLRTMDLTSLNLVASAGLANNCNFMTSDGYICLCASNKLVMIKISDFSIKFSTNLSIDGGRSSIVMDDNGKIFVNSNSGVLKIGTLQYESANVHSVIVTQDHNNLLPFSFISENGFEDNSILSFSIDGTSGEGVFSLSSLNTTSLITSETYIPESIDSKYRHEPLMYADIMVNDINGIKEINTRIEKDIYEYHEPDYCYNAPKFVWDNNMVDEGSSETSDEGSGLLWLGTEDKTINKVYYNNYFAQNSYSSNVSSEVHKILFTPNNSDMYVSGYDHLSRYSVNNYAGDATKATKNIEIGNINNDIISCSNGEKIVSVESYLGQVIIRDRLTLSVLNTYSGFDAPFKVIRSSYHNYYIVAGTFILWKLTDSGIKTPIYQIKDYKIIDLDCSKNGEVCLLLSNGTENIIRILDKNLYTINVEFKTSETNVRFCKYCNNNIFYVLAEKYIPTTFSYTSSHFVANIKDKTIKEFSFESDIVTTTTTTTLSVPTSKMEIVYPNGGESLVKGEPYDILWQSTESINDSVLIELYKGSKVLDVIANNNANSGIYSWTIPTSYTSDTDYKIKIKWLSPSSADNSDISNTNFSIISNVEAEVTTETTTKIPFSAVGIDYGVYNNNVVVILNNGLMGIFDLDTLSFYGLFDSGVKNVSTIGIKDGYAKKYPGNTKVRIFVGSDVYLSDKWDSGEIETELTSMYYGGGNNLVPGEKYYINLQVYSEKYGWSEIQTKEWIMPK